MSIGDHGFTKVAGKEALWLRGTISSMGGSVQLLIVPANDMTYCITIGLRGGGDASADAELKKVVESIGFGGK
jgi:hypothetical protein